MGERLAYTEATRRLLQETLAEIRPGAYLTADAIDFFSDILATETDFQPLSVYVAGGLESVTPLPSTQKHIQIMPLSVYSDRADVVSHYICTYFDGSCIHVYDSLNARGLSPVQEHFLNRLFPARPAVVFETVQQQSNGSDCGFFSIAFAVSIALNRDPCSERYNDNMFADHLRDILRTQRISLFPIHSINDIRGSNTSMIIRDKNFPPLNPINPSVCLSEPSAQTRECCTSPSAMIIDDELNFPPLFSVNMPLSRSVDSKQKVPAKRGRPKKTRGRPRTSTKSREDQHRDAVRKYCTNNPHVHRDSVKIYTSANPEVHRISSQRHNKKNSKSIFEKKKISCVVPYSLQQFTCIGDRYGSDLEQVPLYTLKNKSLQVGAFHCPQCSAPLYEEERTRLKWCCGAGSYIPGDKLPPNNAPFYFNKSFLKDIRCYNNLFSFSAIGVSGGFQCPPNNKGISLVKIQGRVYHRVFDLSYKESVNNGALYIDDGFERMRLAETRKLSPEIVKQITSYLNDVNPFVTLYRQLSKHTSATANIVFQPTSRRVHGPVLGDRPPVSEVAALVRSDGDYIKKSIVVWKIGDSKPHSVPYLHPAYEPLQYVLLYPHGSPGWSPDMKNASGGKITQVKYYRMLILSDPRFVAARRLFQEWVCDMYSRTEEERLQFLKRSQKSALRIATRAELDETIAGEGEILPGKVYLPSSFTHGPRYMRLKYHDAMAIVCRLGQPTYFLTITCNACWPEIISSLLPDQTRIDRPDLCCRVFKLKLDHLIRLISSGALFGKISYILYVIEFQKRGLPHAHITFRVEGGGPVHSTEIDKFVRATIPPADEANGRLRELVIKHMVHGPCGIQSPNAPCMDRETNKCLKHFPKLQNTVTHIDEKGFVQYARSNKDTLTLDNGKVISDEWIVPYNPALLLLMDSHCNLEIASSRRIIKYLFKYIHKGPDHANIGIAENSDEIESYVTMRYISASEALWRFFEFDICYRRPSVIPLPVHLPNHDPIIFHRGSEETAKETTKSLLLLYFGRPTDPSIACLTYQEFYEKYVIKSKRRSSDRSFLVHQYSDAKHFLYKRQRGQCVSRIHWISPSLGELFFLRMLLQRFPFRSFEDCKTVDGTIFNTFQEAAFVRGILENDGESREALGEASLFKTGRGLRQLYLNLIMHGAPAVIIWNEFRDSLSEDFLEHKENTKEAAYVQALCDIDRMLKLHGKVLTDFGLPDVLDDSTEIGREIIRWNNVTSRGFVESWLDRLTGEQQDVYSHVIRVATGDENNRVCGKVMFLYGPGGSGKTLLLNVITAQLRALGLIVLCCASTGIAALNHEGGTTAHSLFHLPIEVVGTHTTWGISNNSERAALLREASVIIWDEAPMASRYHIECIDRGFKDLMQSNTLFGDKVVIFAGDFRQIPPIVVGGGRTDVVRSSIKSCSFWPDVTLFHLTSSQRCKDDQPYSEFILSVGNGTTPVIAAQPSPLISLAGVTCVDSIDKLVQFVYPSEVLCDPEQCCRRAILSGTNRNIADINSLILQKLPGETTHLFSADSAVIAEDSPDALYFQSDILNTISHPGAPDYDLTLKINSVVVLIRNLSFAHKLVNGTKLIVIGISRRLIEVRRPGENETYLIPRIPFKFATGRSGIEMVRRQFPLKLAYGMTINKAQGQTIELLGVDLRSPVFSHGQLYVALGRVRSAQTIRVLIPADNIVNGVPHTVNIVDVNLL